MMEMPKYQEWLKPDSGESEKYFEKFEEFPAWEYFMEFDEYPDPESPERVIKAFMEDAKQAEKAVAEELMDEGLDKMEAERQARQWPLKDDAPMEIVRDYIEYNYAIQEAAKDGIDL